MRLRIIDRILIALAGLLLLAASVGIAAQAFFHVDVVGFMGSFSPVVVLIFLITVLLGLYCFLILFRRHGKKHGFVTHESENGDVSIAIKAVEHMVTKVADRHPQMQLMRVQADPVRAGVLISLKINLAAGVSIPLATAALQREIKQYVTACSGVDVRDVLIEVDTSQEQLRNSPYMVPELLLPKEGASEVQDECVKDERPAHQRIFSRDEQPVTVVAETAASQNAVEVETVVEKSVEEVKIPENNAEQTVVCDDACSAENQNAVEFEGSSSSEPVEAPETMEETTADDMTFQPVTEATNEIEEVVIPESLSEETKENMDSFETDVEEETDTPSDEPAAADWMAWTVVDDAEPEKQEEVCEERSEQDEETKQTFDYSFGEDCE